MRVWGWDAETHLVQPGLLAPPIVLGSIARESEEPRLLTPDEFCDVIAEAYFDGQAILAGQNVAYDFACALVRRPSLMRDVFALYDRGQVHDTGISQTLDAIYHGYLVNEPRRMIIDPRTGKQIKDPLKGNLADRYTLAIVADVCLGRKFAKANDRYRMSYALLENVPFDKLPKEAVEYPLDDARNSRDVAIYQRANNKNQQDLPAQCRAAFAAHLGAVWGIKTDATYARMKIAEYESELHELEERLKSDGFIRDDGTKDMKLICERVRLAYDGNPPLTDTGRPSASKETLEESGMKSLQDIAAHTHGKKMVSTYLEKLAVDIPLNIQPNILLATGRASYDGIIQLLPRKGGIREAFVARPGRVMCSVDYAAVELVGWAQACINLGITSKMAEALNNDMDPHCILGAQLVNRPYEEVLAGKKGEFRDIRQGAKAGNFGLPGGMGVVTWVISQKAVGLNVCEVLANGAETVTPCGTYLAKEWKKKTLERPVCEKCLIEASRLKEAWMGSWTEARQYFNVVSYLLKKNDNRLTQFVSGRERGGLRFSQGCNTLFQGLVADGAKAALWALTREAYIDNTSPLFGSRVLVFAHDEVIMEHHEDRAHEAAMRQTKLMIDAMREYCPDVKVSAEPALMQRWYKQAESVFVKGRLVPWEPKP